MVWTLVGVRDFLFTTVNNGPEANLASYKMGTESFPQAKRPGHGVSHPPRLAPILSMGGAIPLIPLFASTGMLRDDLYFYRLCKLLLKPNVCVVFHKLIYSSSVDWFPLRTIILKISPQLRFA
jgi:hypothetical protein